jgi:hypothetical protein
MRQTGRYIFVWKTAKTWALLPAGPCRQFILKFIDGSIWLANLQFR